MQEIESIKMELKDLYNKQLNEGPEMDLESYDSLCQEIDRLQNKLAWLEEMEERARHL